MSSSTPFVDFMIVGAMKSGTTTLADILKNHDRVSFCSTKEPQFFSESLNWKSELQRYKDLYNFERRDVIRGEASTGYTMYPEFNKRVWEDIYEFNPNMKIIYIMRDPVERVVSHYVHNYMRGYTRRSFKDAVILEPSYINRTRYYTQIKPYIDTFGRQQVLLITFEDFLRRKKEVLSSVADFLSIGNNFKDFEGVHSNKAKEDVNITLNRYLRDRVKNKYLKKVINKSYKWFYKISTAPPDVTPEMKELIWRMLEQDVENIEKVLGRKLVEWSIYKGLKYQG